MKKIESITKKIFFDGNQELLKEQLVLNINNQEVNVIPSSFIDQPLLELENIEGIIFMKLQEKKHFN